MKDEDIIEDWSIYEPLKQDLRLGEKELEKLFKDEDEPFAAAPCPDDAQEAGNGRRGWKRYDCSLAR